MDRQTLRNKGQNGFTLVELMFAIFVFAVGALGVATMQISAMQGNTKGRSITEASTNGTNIYEELFTLPYDYPSLVDIDSNGVAGLWDGTENIPTTPDGSLTKGKYTIFWNVAQDDFIRECKTVAVHIQWIDRGVTRIVSMHHVLPLVR
jgi:prepilin-type N-terminal cleavage/methylation domain-containing protein